MTNRTHQRPSLYVSLQAAFAVLCVFAAAAPTAMAQVMEIDDTGDVTVHDRPEVTSTTGFKAIQAATPRSISHVMPKARTQADIADAARRAEISVDLVEAVAWRESDFKPGLVSSVGAIGEMQLMPNTARNLGVDPYDSRQNFNGGAAYLSALLKRYDGDLMKTLAAYNAGPKAVDRYGGVPPFKETQAYVAAVLDRLSRIATDAPER